MNKYKVKQKIWKITISKYKNEHSKYSLHQDGIKVEELKILGISPFKIVLDDNWFTTLDNDDREGYRKDRSLYTYIDDISVSIRTSGFLEPGVVTRLYSTKLPDKKLLSKMVRETEKEINKEYGFLFGGVIREFNKFVEDYE
jgi:hypothetical protein